MFLLGKLFLLLLKPLTWIIVLFLISIVSKNPKRKKRYLITAFLLLIFFSNPFFFRLVAEAYEKKPVTLTTNDRYQAGIVLGGAIAINFFANPEPIQISSKLAADLARYGITDHSGVVPNQVFSWNTLFTVRGAIMMVAGGFLVGFGTRYAGGCTSGHSIMGLSMLQWPSLVATCCFMAGGFIMTNLFLPFILSL